MISREVTITNSIGLHARPATFFIQKANAYKASIWVEKEDRRVNAKSLLGVLSLGIVGGTSAADANAEMLQYIRSNVRSSFDKVFEDALGIYGSVGNDLYHKIIQNGGAGSTELSSIRTNPYEIGSNMTTIYAGLIGPRKSALQGLVDAFEAGNFGD